MVSLWVLIGLVMAAVSVSTLGAAFSVFGLGQLFSGAAMAVWLMAGALEFSKFVITAFLHQRWQFLNILYKWYLLLAVVTLSLITSMGIFGFLSNAYEQSSTTLEAEQIKLEALKGEQTRNAQEIERLNKNVEEIPITRITKKMKARTEAEPIIKKLTERSNQIADEVTKANLTVLEVKKKVGPLIYIARAFNRDIDSVVKYLILIFVLVFDPLAICLVIAMSEAMRSRQKRRILTEVAGEVVTVPQNMSGAPVGVAPSAGAAMPGPVAMSVPMPGPLAPAPMAQAVLTALPEVNAYPPMPTTPPPNTIVFPQAVPKAVQPQTATQIQPPPQTEVAHVDAENQPEDPTENASDADVIQMRYANDKKVM